MAEYEFAIGKYTFNLRFGDNSSFSVSHQDSATRFSIPLPTTSSLISLFKEMWNPPMVYSNPEVECRLLKGDRIGLRGLLPPRIISFDQRYNQFINSYESWAEKAEGQAEVLISSEKLRILNLLHDTDEVLYYRVLIDKMKEFAPIVYSPSMDLASQNYSTMFRRSQGIYLNAEDKGNMSFLINNWTTQQQVDVILLTDGSNILGHGDLGVALGIPIGKVDMYVAAAGIHPQRILPVMLDVGTNNQELRDNSLYPGLRQARMELQPFLSIVEEFVQAVHGRWPQATLQIEEFEMKCAVEILERYSNEYCMFSDDIQGTAGVLLAGVLGSVRVQGRVLSDFTNQRMVVAGPGSVALPFLRMAARAASRIAEREVPNHYFLIDTDGLMTRSRENIAEGVEPFAIDIADAHLLGLYEGATLLDVVMKVKPHVLVGLSGVGGIFTKEVLMAMRLFGHARSGIFAMSYPLKDAECTAEDAFKYAGEGIIFGSGSPFQNLDLGNGKVGYVNQMHNFYFFPGVVLGAIMSGARLITDDMLVAAAARLAACMLEGDIQLGILFPPSVQSREWTRHFTAEVGAAVMREAITGNIAQGRIEMELDELAAMGHEQMVEYLKKSMWYPV